ncbi:MAG: phosphodiester glycosidase family protein [Deltaproteobacteria bacterium]|nr:phosphodiester glycosidase family protein [Deltaproteobacteria bacterium]
MSAWLHSIIFICGFCLLAPLSAGAAGLSHTPPQWQSLGRGLSFTQVDVFREGEDNEVVSSLAVVKIDPASNSFRVFHQAPQSINQWQQQLQAPIVFNASFYGRNNQPVGLVIADGQAIGMTHNRQMRGMFVAEPRGMSPDLPRATILDLLATPINPRKLPWTQGVQSFPLLLDYKGNIRVRDSEKRSIRTVIATDRVGNILVFNTSNRFFTLRELAQFLKDSGFNIDSALNLDGGTEAQLLIKTKDLEFFSPPSWENSLGNIFDQKIYWLPTVIGVFPRQD